MSIYGLTETAAGTILLEGLTAYSEGDFDAAKEAAARARAASPDAFAARYVDRLAYDAISQRPLHTATRSARRALVALGDTRQALFPLAPARTTR